MMHLRPTRSAKGYAETSDLTILFNTAPMPQNNPLLVLSAYGTTVWQGITRGRAMSELRADAQRRFGADEVVPFAQRLMRLGFLEHDPELLAEPAAAETIVKELHAPEVQFSLTQARVPWYCLWELCTICDLRCRICYLPQFRDPGPTRAEAQRLIEQIVDAGVFYVGLLGGEVLLRDDLEEIVAGLRSHDIFVKIITNGQLLTAERARSLAAAGLNQIEISFDGMYEQMHEASRGPSTFGRAIDGLRNASAAGIPRLGMVLTVHADNVDELDEVPEFMRRHGVSDCYISPFKKTGLLGARSAFEVATGDARQRLATKLQAVRARSADLRISLLSECSCARTSIVIGADQQLRLCTFEYDGAIGDLRERTLEELWRSLGDRTAEAGPLGYCSAAKCATT